MGLRYQFVLFYHRGHGEKTQKARRGIVFSPNFMNIIIMNRAENRLPQHILDKAIKIFNEYGWRKEDFIDVVKAAKEIPMAVIGGQVMYFLPDGTCELYWRSYDPADRKPEENWITYCNRTAKECIEKFKVLVTSIDIKAEALTIPFLENKDKEDVNIDDYKVFVLYFDDAELG
jgi:hypothetical protein